MYDMTYVVVLIRICNSTAKVLQRAEEVYKLGDEETAYVMYMKYFNLIEIVKQAKDFHKIKDKTKKIFGSKQEIYARMDILEKLKDSLLKR